MKYNFDKVHDRIHDPYSYSMKYTSFLGPSPKGKMFGFPNDTLPDDTLAFFLADMDFDIAPQIVEACIKAAQFPNYGYSSPSASYYEAVQRWFRDKYNWNFDTSDIYYCNGTHPGVEEAVKKFTNPDAGVMIFVPSYGFRNDVEPTGRHYVPIQFIEKDAHFSIDWDAFEECAKGPNNEAFIIVQPHNPCGFVYTVEEMQKIAKICRENNAVMIADMVHIDIHRKGVNPVPFPVAAGVENVVALTGLAKTFNIAGLNMSNMIVSDPRLKEIIGRRIAGATPFGTAAATAAYTQCDDWVEELNDYIDGLVKYVIDFVHTEMPKLKMTQPDASYVIFFDFRAYGLTSDELDERIVKRAHLLLGNGQGFEGIDGEQWRRKCITSPMADVKEAMNRLKKAFEDLN